MLEVYWMFIADKCFEVTDIVFRAFFWMGNQLGASLKVPYL